MNLMQLLARHILADLNKERAPHQSNVQNMNLGNVDNCSDSFKRRDFLGSVPRGLVGS